MKLKNGKKKLNEKTEKYKANNYVYGSQQFETITSFGDSIYTGKTNIDKTERDQSNLLENIIQFLKKSKPN